jgi:nucleotide-binding universal stress UspA family protein
MKNILVPIDFSDASINAVSYAAFLANAFDTGLLLVHAYSGTSAIDEEPNTKVYDSFKELEADNEKLLKREIEAIAGKFTVKIKNILKKGNAVNVINEVAEENHSDIIVMGMKGKGESNSIFGSTTTSMINKTSIPLLVIPKNASYQTINSITLASDFNDEKLLTHFSVLEKLMARFDPFIQVLNVQKKDSKLTAEVIAGKMSSGLMWDKYNHSFNIIEEDNIEDGINKFLKKRPTDLLIMVARKRNLITQFFETSHTRKMTYQTKIPLLILHE